MSVARSASTGGLGAWWRELPRVVKWAAAGLGILALYLGVVDPALAKIQAWSVNDRTLETQLRSRAGDAARDTQWVQTIELGKRRFGSVLPPGDEQKRPLELGQAVDEVLRRHGVSEASKSSRRASLPPGELTKKLAAERRLGIAVQDVRFNATPEVASRVLADLEQMPVVASVSRVEINQTSGDDKAKRLVQVALSVETLVVEAKVSK